MEKRKGRVILLCLSCFSLADFKERQGSEFCYISIVSAASKIDAIWFLYIESGCTTPYRSKEYNGY